MNRRIRASLVVTGAVLGIAVGALTLGGCVSTAPRPQAPPPLNVQAPAYLTVAIQGMTKQPMAEKELKPPEKAGFHWEYEVVIHNAGPVGLRLEMLRMSVRSLNGAVSSGVQSLPSRVEPGSSTPITVQAFLSTSDVKDPGDLAGTNELTFLGTDDRGQPVQLVVKVPLE